MKTLKGMISWSSFLFCFLSYFCCLLTACFLFAATASDSSEVAALKVQVAQLQEQLAEKEVLAAKAARLEGKLASDCVDGALLLLSALYLLFLLS